MPNKNQVILEGHLGGDPETKQIKGKDFASFSLATKEKFGEKESTDWHHVECWNIYAKLATLIKKGNAVHVDGVLKSRTYEKDGKKQTFIYVRANTWHKIEYLKLTENQTDQVPIPDNVGQQPSEDDLPF